MRKENASIEEREDRERLESTKIQGRETKIDWQTDGD